MPDFVTTGDVDGDGKADLVTASFDHNVVSVLLGNGDGTFQPAVEYAAGTGPCAVVLGDFTGDGKLDIAVAKSFDTNLTILKNNGDGTFQAPANASLAFAPADLTACDFNGDGKLDLAAADFFGDKVAIMLGNGDGTFQTAICKAVGQGPTSITAGDFNADGKTDVATANFYDGKVSVLLGNGDGTLQSPSTLIAEGGATFVAAADIDADGDLDLVCANANADSITVFTGNGDGTFQFGANFATGNSPRSLVLGQCNAGGVLDVAVANQGDTTVSVMMGAAATPPSANINGPYNVNEGGTVPLSAAGSSGSGLTYAWDLDGDGIYGEIGAAAKRGNETGMTPVFSAATIDGPDSRTIRVKVTDSNHLTDIATGTVSILNVPPTLTLSGAATAAKGVSYTLHLSHSDPGADTITKWVITWGDGTTSTINANPATVSKIYANNGSYTITATATDEDGTDNSGNSVGVTVITDTTPPTATISSAPNIATGGSTTYSFSVTYADNFAMDASSFDNSDILVTGPSGFSQLARRIAASGTPGNQVVTYRINTPGGTWDPADNGAYTIALRPSQVRDAAGNYAAAKTLGSFQVGVLPPDTSGNSLGTALNMGTVILGGARAAVDGVGINDRNDFFKFSITAPLNVYAKLYQMTDNADLMLMDSNGNRIRYSKALRTATEAFTMPLSAGTYYVRVLHAGVAGTAYRLRFGGESSTATTSAARPTTNGNSLATPRNLGVFSAGPRPMLDPARPTKSPGRTSPACRPGLALILVEAMNLSH